MSQDPYGKRRQWHCGLSLNSHPGWTEKQPSFFATV